MKIDNIVIRGACINGEHHWVVYFYDNSGNEMEKKRLLYERDLVGKNSALVTYFKDGQEFKQNFETIRETIDENL